MKFNESGSMNFDSLLTEHPSDLFRENEYRIISDLLTLLGSLEKAPEDLLKRLTLALKRWSGCDAVGVRLKDGADYPYFETSGFPESFVLAESSLCHPDAPTDAEGNPVLDCICGSVIQGRTDPAKPFFTENGSFWTGSTTELLARTSEGDRTTRTRNRCNGEGYESVALIPLRVMGETFGLLQFNDFRKGLFSEDRIRFFEKIANVIALALSHDWTRARLRESMHTMRALINAPEDSMFMLDADGRVIDINVVAAERLGKTPQEIIGRSVFDFLPAEVARFRKEKYRQSFDTGEKVHFEDTRDQYRFEHFVYPVKDDRGEVRRVAVFARDITEKKRSIQDLKSSAEIFEAIPAGLFIYRFEPPDRLVLVRGNPEAEKLTGIRVSEWLGREFREIWPRSMDTGLLDRFLGVARSGGTIELDDFEYADDRLRGAYKIRAFAMSENRLGIAFEDVTAKVESRKALKRSQRDLTMHNRFATLFLTVPGDSVFSDVLRIVQEYLESPYGYFGYVDDAGNLVCPSMTRNILEACDIPDKTIVFEQHQWGGVWGDALKRKTPCFVNDGLELPEGHLPFDCALAVPILFRDELIGQFVLAGKPSGYTLADQQALEDIAARVAPILKARIDRERAENERLAAIREKAEIEKQLYQLQKMEAIGTLASGIAHDFNNILLPIIGYVEMMMDDATEENPHRRHLQQVFQAAQRARELVKQILAFSRETDTERRPLRINLVVKEALKLVRSSFPATIDIEYYIPGDCGVVMANPIHIHQVVMNLVTNALHAMQETGGKLIVRMDKVRLGQLETEEPALAAGDYLRLAVQDTGIGMDANTRRRIFDPYFTTKAPEKGTGLGLAVVHGIVRAHGGEILVESEAGKGSTFIIHLPLIPVEEKEETAAVLSAPPAGTEHVMLVDDETQVVTAMEQMLRRLGYRVEAFTRSTAALERFREDPDTFDLIITDMTMPKLTGAQLARSVMEIRPDMPIIICTGFSEVMNEEKARSLGIRGFLMKPIVKNQIAAKIRQVLDDA